MGLLANDIEMLVLSCCVVVGFFCAAFPLHAETLSCGPSLTSLQLNQELDLQTGAGSAYTLSPARSPEKAKFCFDSCKNFLAWPGCSNDFYHFLVSREHDLIKLSSQTWEAESVLEATLYCQEFSLFCGF